MSQAFHLSALAMAVALGLAAVRLTSADEPVDAGGTDNPTASAAFLAENEAAMTTMMNGMAVTSTGDIDRDFAAMMIPHHQGAIDMALAELRHGRSEQLRRIAQGIVVEQMQEIAAMRMAIGEPLAVSGPAPTQPVALQSASSIDPMSTAMSICRSNRRQRP